MFATIEDLEAMLQTDFAVMERISGETHLRNATGRIRGWTGQHIAPAVEYAHTVLDADTRRIFLPHPPIIPVTVTSVEVDDVALDAADWQIDRLHTLARTDKIKWRGDVTVTYQAGFAEAPEDVSAVCVQVAVRRMTNPTNVQSVKIEGFSETHQTSAAQSDEGLIATLDRYRHMAVG